jgi:hypothetical protein
MLQAGNTLAFALSNNLFRSKLKKIWSWKFCQQVIEYTLQPRHGLKKL